MEAAIPSQEINPGELGDLGGVNSDRYCIYLVLRESTFQNLARDQGGLQVGLFGSVSPYSLEQNSEQEHAISRTAQPSCVSASIHYPSLTPPSWQLQVCSLCLGVYFCFVDKLICVIFF